MEKEKNKIIATKIIAITVKNLFIFCTPININAHKCRFCLIFLAFFLISSIIILWMPYHKTRVVSRIVNAKYTVSDRLGQRFRKCKKILIINLIVLIFFGIWIFRFISCYQMFFSHFTTYLAIFSSKYQLSFSLYVI